jgi:hypothetical protein
MVSGVVFLFSPKLFSTMASAAQFIRGANEDANDEEMELRAYRRLQAAEQSTVVTKEITFAPLEEDEDGLDAAEKALRAQRRTQLVATLAKTKKGWAWDETLDMSGAESVATLMQNPDNDLKREVIFYNQALVRRCAARAGRGAVPSAPPGLTFLPRSLACSAVPLPRCRALWCRCRRSPPLRSARSSAG